MEKPYRRVIGIEIPENTSLVLFIPLLNHLGVAIDPNVIDTVTLKLYDQKSGDVITSPNPRDIKNANGGTLDADGVLTLELSPSDNALVDSAGSRIENHIALVEWTFDTGSRAGAVEIVYPIKNLTYRP